jgi:predicted outer membrane repeat protein
MTGGGRHVLRSLVIAFIGLQCSTGVQAASGSGCADAALVIDVTAPTVAACSAESLQAAINTSSNNRVQLPANCTVTLSAPLQINRDIVIDGNGATISGNNLSRIFEINRDYAQNRGHRFTLQNAALINGRDSGSGGAAIAGAQFGDITVVNVSFSNNVSLGSGGEDGGGAIFKDEGGKLTVFNSTFQNNTATNGGAIKSLGANVQVVNSAFIDNVARGGNNGGGAHFVDGLEVTTPKPSLSQGGYAPNGYSVNTYGKARFCGVLYRGNSVGGLHDGNVTGRQGGALFTHVYGSGGAPIPGTPYFTSAGYTVVEVERSIFEDNTAFDGGGALRLGGDGAAASAPAEISSSQFRNNRAGNHGGAIRMSQTEANYSNLVVADNCANADNTVTACTSNSAAGGLGGGIVAFEKKYNVDRLTVVRNRAASYGGGLNQTGPMTAQLGAMTRSIVAANTTGNPYNVGNQCAGPVFSNGAASYQWPGPTNPNFDAACGAVNTANPNVSSSATLCTTRAGSSLANAFHYVMLAASAVSQTNGLPDAGAICPSLPGPAPAPGVALLNIDASAAATQYDAATDGALLQRFLFGYSGAALVAGVTSSTATRSATEIAAHLSALLIHLDIDGDGMVSANTDGALILRYLRGLRGNALVQGVSRGPNNAGQIEANIKRLMP